MLTAYVASLYTRGLSVHTVNGHIRIIKAFYNYLGVRQHIQYSLSLHFKTS
jgi:site-specific recombinase XerD